jgi:hypothetical protein
MLHVWLIPMVLILLIILVVFYLVIRNQGGSGARTEGRTLLDKPDEENPPSE